MSDTQNATLTDSTVKTSPSPGPAPTPRGETGGPKGPEPTRFGDWERKGKCVDF